VVILVAFFDFLTFVTVGDLNGKHSTNKCPLIIIFF
jgi:hypothetical protein